MTIWLALSALLFDSAITLLRLTADYAVLFMLPSDRRVKLDWDLQAEVLSDNNLVSRNKAVL